MLTQVLRVSAEQPEPDLIRQGATALRDGKLVIFPTETVYGIAANALNEAAITKLYAIKGRPKDKPFTWHIATLSQFKEDLENCPAWLDELLKKFWPGPLTVVVPTKNGETRGYRMPDHPVALALIEQAEVPVVAPSANLSGKLPPTTLEEALVDLEGQVDLAIDAGKTRFLKESTVLDCTQPKPKILRQGALQIEKWLEAHR